MKYLVAIHRPEDYDDALESEEMASEIRALNLEMIEAGVRSFAGGLRPVSGSKSIRKLEDGKLLVSDGPYLETKEHVGGFWILECQSIEEAVEWAKKAVIACRASVEVRPFY